MIRLIAGGEGCRQKEKIEIIFSGNKTISSITVAILVQHLTTPCSINEHRPAFINLPIEDQIWNCSLIFSVTTLPSNKFTMRCA